MSDSRYLPPPGRPVLLAGPTASGKSAYALEWAAAQGRVIINADALQVYDMWRVLTARPDAAELARVPHFLYGHVGRTPWSVGAWLRDVAAVLARHPDPVIVGGTGLYFDALTRGLAEIPPVPGAVRLASEHRLRTEGAQALLAELDRATAARLDHANPVRIQRAWEVLQATGSGLAHWQDRTGPPLLAPERATAIMLDPDRDWLAQRIDSRFAAMLEAGALDEARAALRHWDPSAPWARAIGARELVTHLRGQISLHDATAAATLATRQYAKRQRSWFRNRMRDWHRWPLP